MTQWLDLPASPGPVAKDAATYAMTVTRDGKETRRAYHDHDNVQAYVNLVRFLRRIERQEELFYSISRKDRSSPLGWDLGDELDAVLGKPGKTLAYAPALDYNRLAPLCSEVLQHPREWERYLAGAAKLLGYLKLESQRGNLEAVARGRVPADPTYSVPLAARTAALEGLTRLGAAPSMTTLEAAAEDK